jgi:hypothetical protein
MRVWPTALMLLVCAASPGCGKSPTEVVGENAPYFAELRRQLGSVAQAVEASPPGAVDGPCPPGSALDANPESSSYNLDVLHFEQLTNPEVELKEAGHAIDLMASTSLGHCLHWTGPQSKLSPDADGRAVAQSFARCRQVDHLLVAREVAHHRETAELRMRYDLVRIADARVLCSFEVATKGDPTLGVVSYEIRRGKSDEVVKRDRRDEYASKLWSQARQDLAKAAKERLGVGLGVK